MHIIRVALTSLPATFCVQTPGKHREAAMRLSWRYDWTQRYQQGNIPNLLMTQLRGHNAGHISPHFLSAASYLFLHAAKKELIAALQKDSGRGMHRGHLWSSSGVKFHSGAWFANCTYAAMIPLSTQLWTKPILQGLSETILGETIIFHKGRSSWRGLSLDI